MKTLLVLLSFLFWDSVSFAYTPPAGIPDPGTWGTTHPIDTAAPDTATKCPAWPSGLVTGCYYIDSTAAGCDDDDAGTPDDPRCTLGDLTLAAGSYVEIHGGPYEITAGDDEYDWVFQGTAESPVWVRGPSFASRPTISGLMMMSGSYAIVENINFNRWSSENKGRTGIGDGSAVVANHVALRHCTFIGDGVFHTGFTAQISIKGLTGNETNNIVLYDLDLRNFDSRTYALETAEDDDHAFLPGQYTNNIWILDSTVNNISGDAVQVTGNNAIGDARSQYVYIGGNDFSETGENAVDVKSSLDVVISENDFYIYDDGVGSDGTAIVIQQEGGTGSDNIWILFNKIHSAYKAIRAEEVVTNMYVIGNLIYDQYTVADSTHSDCAHFFGGGYVYFRTDTVSASVIDNTFYNYQGALGWDNEPTIAANGNLFYGRAQATGFDMCNGTDIGTSTYDYNLFDTGHQYRVRMGANVYETNAALISGESKCTNCISGAASISMPSFALLGSSDAIDANAGNSAYATFATRYGVSIAKDYYGTTRPVNTIWDIGAYEYNEATAPQSRGTVLLGQ